jgi:arylsulfatase A-like enzyme
MLAVVLSFDQFPMRLLSCYGNFDIPMPGLSRMAADSVVFDQHFGEDFSEAPQGHAWWSGCYHYPRAGTELHSKIPSLPELLAEGNIQSQWLTDEAKPRLVPLPQDAPVSMVESFADLIQRGCEELNEAAAMPDLRRLVWLKAGRSIWSEAEGSESVMAQIDAAVMPLWNRLQGFKESRQVLFILTSARGMSLGERNAVPKCESTWAEEFVHLPLIVFHSDHPGGERRSAFTQSIDLPATLLDFFALRSKTPCEGESFLPILRGEDIE